MTPFPDFYAIQQISTGLLLPAPRGRSGRGGTHVEFLDPGPPRLFNSLTAAKNALRWWLGGAVNVTHYESLDGEIDESWSTENLPHRLASDCRIVKIKMEINPQ